MGKTGHEIAFEVFFETLLQKYRVFEVDRHQLDSFIEWVRELDEARMSSAFGIVRHPQAKDTIGAMLGHKNMEYEEKVLNLICGTWKGLLHKHNINTIELDKIEMALAYSMVIKMNPIMSKYAGGRRDVRGPR